MPLLKPRGSCQESSPIMQEQSPRQESEETTTQKQIASQIAVVSGNEDSVLLPSAPIVNFLNNG